jgi:hypothetical protein
MPHDKQTLWAKFEADGESKVREKLTMGLYGEQKAKFAKEWLREREAAQAGDATTRSDKTLRVRTAQLG